MGFSGGSVVKNSPFYAGDMGSILGLERSPGEGNGNPLPVFLPGKSHGQRNLVGCSPWDCKKTQTWLSNRRTQIYLYLSYSSLYVHIHIDTFVPSKLTLCRSSLFPLRISVSCEGQLLGIIIRLTYCVVMCLFQVLVNLYFSSCVRYHMWKA